MNPRPPPSINLAVDQTGSVCASAGGIPGIESPVEFLGFGHVCCLIECGRCGGVNCSKLTGLSTECCITDMTEQGEACSVTNEAPCFIDDGASITYSQSAARYFGILQG